MKEFERVGKLSSAIIAIAEAADVGSPEGFIMGIGIGRYVRKEVPKEQILKLVSDVYDELESCVNNSRTSMNPAAVIEQSFNALKARIV